MAIEYDRLMRWPIPDARQEYTEKDCILYALGIGLGGVPLDPSHLRYVYEGELEAFPAMALVLAVGPPWARAPGTEIDYSKVVQAEQSFTLHRPLPVRGSVLSRARVAEVIDKGPGRGAIVTSERLLFIDEEAEPVATVRSTLFCRADGGLGGPASAPSKPEPVPDCDPDVIVRLPIPPNLALVYRLSGDRNEIHADPAAARLAGFPAPILHGLCSFAVALRAVAEGMDVPARVIVGAGVRFTTPVYPGETLGTMIWRQAGGARFRTHVAERDVTALDFGWVRLE